MAATSTLSIEEYLRTTDFHPDVEFLDGRLEERKVGKWEHSRIQFLIALWFGKNEAAWGVRGVTEQRMRVSPTRIRIPDVALLPPGQQPEIITRPPVLVVEILSPEDRYTDSVAKAREYLAWGVHTAWIIHRQGEADGLTGEIWTKPGVGIPAQNLTVSGTDIYLNLVDLFQALNQS